MSDRRVPRVLIVVAVAAGCSQPARDGVVRSAPEASIADAATSDAATPPDTAPLAVVDAPIRWTPERERLTLAYRRQHSDRNAQDVTIEPRVIVLHYTGGNSAAATRKYFDNVRIERGRKQLARAGAVNVSSHFLVDRDGTIYRLQPETRFARHCIGLNHVAIGVENVGDGSRWPLTEAQVAANAALVRDLAARFPITHVLGHHEVMSFREHSYYVELEPRYRNQKPDPGETFMQRVRALVADLALSGGAS